MTSPQRTSQQRPIHSGFDRATTTTDVLDGVDLTGKVALITGGYSGLGLAMTSALAGAGAEVIVPARRPEVAREALADIPRVTVGELDLSDLGSVERFAASVRESGIELDIVIAAAGIMAAPERRVGDGWESQFAVNFLGHYALINHLWPVIADGARIVSMASAGHFKSPIRWDDIHFTNGYDKWLAYGQSKTASALLAVHLDELGKGRGIRAFSVHPGGIATPLQRHIPAEEFVELGWADADGNPAAPDAVKTPEQGAATAVWAVTSPQLADIGGVYLEDCDVALPVADATPSPFGSGVEPYASDPAEARRLWRYAADITGIDEVPAV